MRRLLIIALALTLGLALLAAPTIASAHDRQLVLGADLSYAHEFGDESRPGGGAGVHVWYKIHDYVAFGGAVAWAGHAATNDVDESVMRNVITAATGFYFLLDIIRFVPYAGILVGAAFSFQDNFEPAYLLNVCLGGDYLVNPFFTTGIEVAYQFTAGEEILPARLVASIRLNWRHMFF